MNVEGIRLLLREARSERTDGELLDEFRRRRGEEAFDELLRRHGPMVRAVCRRMLGPTADADDAFQATFLVLVRRSHAIRRRELLANWLCAVAYRVGRQLRRTRLRQFRRERQVSRMPEPAAHTEEPRDWLPLFDAALQSLPARYRDAVVLCELHGLTRSDAARRLGLGEGTLSSRLARARVLLRRRLGRHGFPLAAGAALAPTVVPEALAATTTRHALAVTAHLTPLAGLVPGSILQLMGDVMRETLLSKVRTSVILIAVLLVAAPLAVRLSKPTFAQPSKPATPAAKAKATPDEKPEAPPTGRGELEGTWRAVSVNGRSRVGVPFREGTNPLMENNYVTGFAGDQVRMQLPVTNRGLGQGGLRVIRIAEIQTSFTIDDSARPQRITIGTGPFERSGIYKRNKDRLTICLSEPGMKQPADFDAAATGPFTLLELERFDPKAGERRPGAPNEPVAIIHDNVKITRAEYGDFLIRCYGAEKLQAYVNLRIIERAAATRGIVVTEAEVADALRHDLKAMGESNPDNFTRTFLTPRMHTLTTWREQVIRPRLLMEKLCGTKAGMTEAEQRHELAAFAQTLIGSAKPQLLLK